MIKSVPPEKRQILVATISSAINRLSLRAHHGVHAAQPTNLVPSFPLNLLCSPHVSR